MSVSYPIFIQEIIDECLLDAQLPLSDVQRVRHLLTEQYVKGVLFCSTDYKETADFLYGQNDDEFYYIVSFCVQEEYIFLVYKQTSYDSRKWYTFILDELKSQNVEGRIIGERFVLLKNLGSLVHGVFSDCVRSKRKAVGLEHEDTFIYPPDNVLKEYYECGRKRKFTSSEEAWNSKDSFGSEDVSVYVCPWCQSFHIGRGKVKGLTVPEEIMIGRYKTAWRRYQKI